jgi:molecular chaperone GrpE
VREQSEPDDTREQQQEDQPSSLSAVATPAVLPTDAAALEAFGQRARLAEDRLAEVLGAYRQIKADQEGQRERMTRALERRFEQRHERLLVKFIDVLDCFDRALEAAEQTYAGAPLIEGLILVRTQLLQTLRDEGLERIPVLGLPFDPHVSEAMGTAGVEDPDQHHVVVKEYQRGYRFKERVVRPSRVVVGECSEPTAATATAAASAEAQSAAADQPATAPSAPDDSLASKPAGESTADQIAQPAIAVTPLTEEDGAPTIEEIVARAESRGGRGDAFDDDSDFAPRKTNPEDEWT